MCFRFHCALKKISNKLRFKSFIFCFVSDLIFNVLKYETNQKKTKKLYKKYITEMDYCRICALTGKKPLIPVLDDNPLRINEKLQKLLHIKAREKIYKQTNHKNVLNILGKKCRS